MSASVATRRRLVRQIISTTSITSQQELVELLEADGHFVTQATVSRDLDAIGAVKVRSGTTHHYELPEDLVAANSDREMARIIDEFVDAINVSGNMLIIRTRPGAAHVVGSAIDRSDLEGVLGTVAGDDTLLVIAAEDKGGSGLLEELERMGVRR